MISGHYLVSASETNDCNQGRGYNEESFMKNSWEQFVSDRDTGYTAGDRFKLSGHCVFFSEISNEDMQSCQGGLQNAYEKYLQNYISVPLQDIENKVERLREEWENGNRILIYGKVSSDKSILDIIKEILECLVGDCGEIQLINTELQTIYNILIEIDEKSAADIISNQLNMTIGKFDEALGSKLSELGGHIRFLFYIEKQRYHNICGGKEILPGELNAKISCVKNIIIGQLGTRDEVIKHILSMYQEQGMDKNSNPEKEAEKDQNIYKSKESLLVEIIQLIQDSEKEEVIRKIIKEYHINEQGGIEDVR